ncbi:energy-coupling factor ABC transporter permease [Ruminiclostridium cellulolyticum]|uniref:Cobalamin (Vitamin B12) biosynthesis CbiM protein n=1 Tax=Ruminiclostridium cellulolyticum (strain ATCC 35319 / DSM 5812 / JCM 6584 / H10) TaxID=394503 RepID=B8I039_RUMCH|nr:energy-coupling factor ABC transporter permease [Ruminiclostridium cellulolyticum]ACL75539.1 cobalamin (vitamin B12) biosynthesis CbiM protein [Ruminiclostridium cellulolyticum H10]
MHMGDFLLSPAVGGTVMTAAVGTAAVSIKKVRDMDEKKISLMGVMSAFVFAAQMINFTIPGTGSSGHLAGALMLSILLGPYAGFLSIAAILLIQAMFFADGGLLAYGCNVINIGFFACFIAYPLIYRTVTKKGLTRTRLMTGSILASVAALQMGAFSVVIETLLSGKTELPFAQFALAMQGIHLAIGAVEGVVTAVVVSFVWKVRPDIINAEPSDIKKKGYRSIIAGFLVAAALLAGGVSLFASANPDGLEWSIGKVAGEKEIKGETQVHKSLEKAQQDIALLPDYSFKEQENANESAGTVVSGLVGSGITIGLVVLAGYLIKLMKRKKAN